VRRGDIQALVKDWSQNYAPGTVRNYYDVLARLFLAAVEDRVIASTPCKRIALPSMRNAEVTPPTVQDVTQIIDSMPDRYRAAAIMLAGSGLRIGELLGLMVSDVAVPFRTIRVERQRLQSGLTDAPKSGKRRNVPVGQVVLDAVEEHLGAYPSEGWLFTDDSGGPVTYQVWQKAWRPAREKAKCPTMVTHDLRHFFASALIAGGASVKQVQVVMGHSSPVITLRVYAHLWPGDDDRTRDVIDSTLNILRTGCGPDVPRLDKTAVQDG
jgi:integrase